MISPTDYQDIVCLIDSSITSHIRAFYALNDMSEMLASMSISDTRRTPLKIAIDNRLTDLAFQASPAIQLRSFIEKLQKHVQTHYGLTQFLADYGINIPSQVAVLSARAGYTIPNIYISECN
jgi:hypothetical protein